MLADLLKQVGRFVLRRQSPAPPPAARKALAVDALRRGDLAAALDHVEAARREAPLDADVMFQWALTQHFAGRLDQASEGYARAIELDPRHVLARGHLGYLRLATGEFSRDAWALYLANLERRGEDGRSTGIRPWQGESLEGKTILVFGHQGLGDQILFGSCLPDIAARAGRLIVCLEPRLVGLFGRALPGARLEPLSYLEGRGWLQEGLAVDFCAPLGRLAMEYRAGKDAFPRRDHYLEPDSARLARWRRQLDALGPGINIGLSWRGGTPKTRREQRSMGLEQLKPLFDVRHARFVSLQYGEVTAELETWHRDGGRELLHWPEAIADYEETAALACSLDHVVTVTTALAHLCGALGARASVLVDADAQWRYGAAGHTMPWYSSLRLHRQPAPDRWDVPVAAVAAHLRELAAGRNL